MRRTATLLLTLALILGTACGSDEDPTVEVPTGAGDTTSSTTTTTDGTSSTTDAVPADLDAFEAGELSSPSKGYGQLVDIRRAAHDGYYRIVFEFEDAVPGVKVAPTDRPVVQDGSGDEITVAGDQVLLVQFEPASGFDMDASKESYTGPKRLEVEQAPVVELVRVSDFEAHLDWAIGVDDGTRYRLTVLDGPPRVVLDLQSVPDA
jgi:hypothetical protein